MPPRPAPSSAPAPGVGRPRPPRPGDWMWHGLGGGVAAASAGFAAYALAFSTGEVVPSGNFSVFNGYDRLYRAAAAGHAPVLGPGRTDVAKRDGIDLDPTGALPAGRGGAGPDGPTLPGYTLRDVFDGKALVESRSALAVVKPGSTLDGVGEILAIENRGDHWVVLTRAGVIAGRPR